MYLDPEKVQKIVRLLKGKATVYKISEVEKVAVKHTVRKYAELWKTGQLDFLEGPFDEALPTQSISFRSTVLSMVGPTGTWFDLDLPAGAEILDLQSYTPALHVGPADGHRVFANSTDERASGTVEIKIVSD